MKAAATVLAILGATLLAVGLYLGAAGLSRDGIACGSALHGTDAHALHRASQRAFTRGLAATMEGLRPERTPHYRADCQDAVSGRRTVTLALAAPGGALLLSAVVLALTGSDTRRRPDALAASA